MRLGLLPPLALQICAVIWGLLWGSFLNVVIYRLPRGLSVVRPGSQCPHCQKPIAPWHNIPVISWLVLRGKAQCCGASIAVRYPIVEALGAAYALAVLQLRVLSLDPDTSLLVAFGLFLTYFTLGMMLIAASFIDLDHLYIPDILSIGGIVLGLSTFWLRDDAGLVESLVAAGLGFLVVWLVFGVFYRRLRGRTGMGLGDAKLLALAGSWFGYKGVFFALFAGSIQGVLAALLVMIVKGNLQESDTIRLEKEKILAEINAIEDDEQREQALQSLDDDPIFEQHDGSLGGIRIAFGPFLALAIIEYVLFGDSIIVSHALGF